MEDMVEEGLMFPGQDTTILRWFSFKRRIFWQNITKVCRTVGSFPTSFLSQIEADGVGEFHRQSEIIF